MSAAPRPTRTLSARGRLAPGQPQVGLRSRDYLSFGAAVRLGLLPHTASRRQGRRLTTATTACSCLWLAVATISSRSSSRPFIPAVTGSAPDAALIPPSPKQRDI